MYPIFGIVPLSKYSDKNKSRRGWAPSQVPALRRIPHTVLRLVLTGSRGSRATWRWPRPIGRRPTAWPSPNSPGWDAGGGVAPRRADRAMWTTSSPCPGRWPYSHDSARPGPGTRSRSNRSRLVRRRSPSSSSRRAALPWTHRSIAPWPTPRGRPVRTQRRRPTQASRTLRTKSVVVVDVGVVGVFFFFFKVTGNRRQFNLV